MLVTRNGHTFNYRKFSVYLSRNRRPDRTSNDGLGPILHYGERTLVFMLQSNGDVQMTYIDRHGKTELGR